MSKGEMEASPEAKWEELLGELRREWRTMWNERFDDKVNAEGIARQDFPLLFLGRGTVVVATRKFRAPDFFEIVEEHRKLSGADPSPGSVNPCFGGWGKFIRALNKQCHMERSRGRRGFIKQEKNRALQQKKNGRGWLHRV